ncbi:MAG TPA: pyruvate kinase, partial [Polyangiaceae bacterium]
MPGKQPSRDENCLLARQLLKQLEPLRSRVLNGEAGWAKAIARIEPQRRASAMNLAHYLALRQTDIRELQPRLAALGLSRLGRSEAHTLSSINALLAALAALSGYSPSAVPQGPVSINDGSSLLGERARELLGAPSPGRQSRIMVTMPSDAATQPELLRHLLSAGMDVMRINCAHDHADAWLAMIDNLRAAERATGRVCRVYADLAGPKLRTGKLKSIGRLLNFGPVRDPWGRVVRPAQIWLTPGNQPELAPPDLDAVVPVTDELLASARVGDRLCLGDSRGIRREIVLVTSVGRSWLAQGMQRVYLEDGASCSHTRDGQCLHKGCVGPLHEVAQPLVLHKGHFLQVIPDDQVGGPGQVPSEGKHGSPPSIPCTLREVFSAVRPGHAIWFDDGKIGGIVRSVAPERILVEITHAPSRGAKLRPEKGINLPDTELAVPALSEKDLADLQALAPHVDLIGLSFVRRVEDVIALHEALVKLGAEHLGTVLKIETRSGFENLPAILMAGL